MSNTILKSTNCKVFCGFENITSYCLDCPALMCSRCKTSMHNSKDKANHTIIDFINTSLDFDNRDSIANIFEDNNLEEKIYKEVSRRLENPKKEKKHPFPESDFTDKWECLKCTYKNPISEKKCEMCRAFKLEDNSDIFYDEKLELFQNEKLKDFMELDNIYKKKSDMPFENVMYWYTRDLLKNIPLNEWYHQFYPNRKSLAIVNDIIEENGHKIRIIDVDRQVNEIVKSKNEMFLTHVWDPNIRKELSKCTDLLNPKDVNKLNQLTGDMMKPVTGKEVWDIMIKKDAYTPIEIRMLMTELDLNSNVKLDTFRNFLNCKDLGDYMKQSMDSGNVKLFHIKQAISDQVTVKGAFSFLKKSCEICTDEFPIPEMFGLMTCEHEFCKSCVCEYYKEVIISKYPSHWNCPLCTTEQYSKINKNLYYSQLRVILSEDRFLLNVFEEKLLEEQLRQSPNFYWCGSEECTNGFEAEGIDKIQCPLCHKYTCTKCKRAWHLEHENRTCQEFELWILKNDPNLTNLLRNIGIECPGCEMRYALAAGGCLHFDCKICLVKFCGGCDQLFVDKCDKPNCVFNSFHAHHPRNCLYFLRDRTAIELENMLQGADYPKLQQKPERNCQYMITNDNLKDIPCNQGVYATCGLCELHYKEYLAQFINRYQIDPADFADSTALNLMLGQMVVPKLMKNNAENEAQFTDRLRKSVKQTCLFYIPKGVTEKPQAI